MLGRLENIYLGILRVVILIAATLALVVAVIGAITAVPLLLQRVGLIEPNVQAASLAEFMAGQRPDTSGQAGTGGVTTATINPDLAAAARNIHKYLASRSTHPVTHWEGVLVGFAEQVPSPAYSEYAESVKGLSESLLRATGNPLSLEKTEELLVWHFQRFMQGLGERAAAAAEAQAKFLLAMGAAVSAFLIFVFVVFVFIFVKIERSLRLVRTVRETAPADDYRDV